MLALAAPSANAAPEAEPAGLADAARARSLLGADTWCRLVRIENTAPRGLFHRFDYPKVVYAAVFEVSGILWFYTATDGTQSLSRTTRTTLKDEADPGALFRAVYPGFTKWAWVDDARGYSLGRGRSPTNGCFVESVSLLLDRMATGGEALSPRLLSFYVDTPRGRLGHTVLIYGTCLGLAAVDPGISPRAVRIPGSVGDNPMALAAYLRGERVSVARTLPLAFEHPRPALLAEASPSGGGTG